MILKHAKNAFLYPQKEMDISLTMFKITKAFLETGAIMSWLSSQTLAWILWGGEED